MVSNIAEYVGKRGILAADGFSCGQFDATMGVGSLAQVGCCVRTNSSSYTDVVELSKVTGVGSAAM
jgi:hypothetical protein